ncbi:MAG: GNAT family N-acetyltransferase [Burkholderiaceae bacterium]|jgi:GNAT superfamily N-acetyltransferase|nr:GNAT family N-acetyltransferase [Burkholderiaceae bacterium]
MLVRKAVPEDLDRICAIAEAVRLDPAQAQIDGFLVYMYGREGYADRLAATELFDVAVEDGKVVGFLVCFDDWTVEGLVDRGMLRPDVLQAKDVAGCEGRWLYGDQIAVDPEYASHGVALHLVWDLYLKVRRGGFDSVFVAILHEPMNMRSKVLAESLGFSLRGTLRYSDGCLWGLYVRDVPRDVPDDQAPRVVAHGLTEG